MTALHDFSANNNFYGVTYCVIYSNMIIFFQSLSTHLHPLLLQQWIRPINILSIYIEFLWLLPRYTTIIIGLQLPVLYPQLFFGKSIEQTNVVQLEHVSEHTTESYMQHTLSKHNITVKETHFDRKNCRALVYCSNNEDILKMISSMKGLHMLGKKTTVRLCTV